MQTVYPFGGGAAYDDARAKDKTVTGGKGANLAEMASIGLPVPPGLHDHHRGVRPLPARRAPTSPTSCEARSPRR